MHLINAAQREAGRLKIVEHRISYAHVLKSIIALSLEIIYWFWHEKSRQHEYRLYLCKWYFWCALPFGRQHCSHKIIVAKISRLNIDHLVGIRLAHHDIRQKCRQKYYLNQGLYSPDAGEADKMSGDGAYSHSVGYRYFFFCLSLLTGDKHK